MTDRTKLSKDFLNRHGWGDARRRPLADDASFRRYERLTLGTEKAVLMDAPPRFEDVRPFIAVAHHLHSAGLSPPRVMASDCDNGFLLLEDMGDDLFARVIENDPCQERALYQLAIDGLLHLHKAERPTNIPPYDMDLLLAEVGLFVDWYLPALTGKSILEKDKNAFLKLWQGILHPVVQELKYLTLRDYHAENMMLRSGQDGMARLGLLDFQDATLGHKAYDLVSLLQDARRDVSPALERDMLDRYRNASGEEGDNFYRDYAILGAQRSAKIIGIFTRLCLRDGKSIYLDKIPRVWALLERNLAHPVLAPIKQWMDDHIRPEIRAKAFTPIAFMPKKAMILAAGLGKRMRPLTDDCPKPLITVAGKQLLSYSLDGLGAAGVRHVVINMHYLADQMEYFVQKYHDYRLNLSLSDEREALLDSGGGVKNALDLLGDDPFFVLNSDMIWRDGKYQMLQRMQSFWQDDNMDILMLLIPRDKAFGYDAAGDYNRDDQGRIYARGKNPQADYVYGGIMIMKPQCFKGSPEGAFSLRYQFDAAEENGRLYGIIHDGEWYHIGTVEARDKMEGICQDG